MPFPGGTYPIAMAAGEQVGGLFQPSPTPPASAWITYISVTDVDASAKACTANGGTILMPPTTMQGVGRMATLQDPDGAVIAVMHSPDGDRPLPERPGLSTFCWETLITKDVGRAQKFYGAVMGWKSEKGLGGTVDTFVTEGGAQIADIQTASGGMPPMWGTYVVVEKLENARERATKLGGKVLNPLIEIPTVGRIAVIADPTGAVIQLFQPSQG